MNIIKEIAMQEYFCDKFEDIEMLFDAKKKYWKEVENNYEFKMCFGTLIEESDDEKNITNEEFAKSYLNCLKAHNALVFRYYFEIIERAEKNDPKDKIVDEYFEYNMYTCFCNLNPNFKVNDILLYASETWQQRDPKELIPKLDKLTKKLVAKLTKLPKLNKYNYNYVNLFEKNTIPQLIARMSNAYDAILNDENEKYDFNIKIGDLTASQTAAEKHEILSAEEAIAKNFSGLIGFDDAKLKLSNWSKLVKKSRVPINMCCVLTGNPGVGKTTLAQVMHSTLYDMGVLKKDTFVLKKGSELKGRYVGWTDSNVEEIFKSATNGTLLIDEAYSLAGKYNDSFSNEALTKMMNQIDALKTAQEKDLSDKSLVILAGYKKDMDLMLAQNSGASRRFPTKLDLKDYSDEELFEIFKLQLQKAGFEMTQKDETLIQDLLTNYTFKKRRDKNFENAGLIENVLQKAYEIQAGRTDENDFNIVPEDIEKAIVENKALESNFKMGF